MLDQCPLLVTFISYDKTMKPTEITLTPPESLFIQPDRGLMSPSLRHCLSPNLREKTPMKNTLHPISFFIYCRCDEKLNQVNTNWNQPLPFTAILRPPYSEPNLKIAHCYNSSCSNAKILLQIFASSKLPAFKFYSHHWPSLSLVNASEKLGQFFFANHP